MLRFPARAAFGDLAGGVGAARDGVRVDAERAMLEHGLDDHAQARIEPRPVLRPFGRGQAGMSEPELGDDLGERVEPRTRPGAGIGKPKGIEPCRHHRRQAAVAGDGIGEVEHEERPARGQRLEARKVVVKPDDLGGIAEPRDGSGHGPGGGDRVDLVGAAFRRRVHDRDEARRACHHACFRRDCLARLSP